jgi:hypothetical protein
MKKKRLLRLAQRLIPLVPVMLFIMLALLVSTPVPALADTIDLGYANNGVARISAIKSRGDPFIAHSWKIAQPTGADSLTGYWETQKIPVPIGADTATISILSSTGISGEKISKVAKGSTPALCVKLLGKSLIYSATPIALDCSLPSSATTEIFDQGRFTFPVDAGGELILCVSAASDATTLGPSSLAPTSCLPQYTIDIQFDIEEGG